MDNIYDVLKAKFFQNMEMIGEYIINISELRISKGDNQRDSIYSF